MRVRRRWPSGGALQPYDRFPVSAQLAPQVGLPSKLSTPRPPSSKSCTVFLPSAEAKRFWICAVTFFSSDALHFCLAFSILGSWHQKIQNIRHSTSCIATAPILHACSTYRKLKHPLLFETLLAKGMLLMNERNIMLAQGILVTAKRRCLYPGHCCCGAERLSLPIPRYRAVSMQKY